MSSKSQKKAPFKSSQTSRKTYDPNKGSSKNDEKFLVSSDQNVLKSVNNVFSSSNDGDLLKSFSKFALISPTSEHSGSDKQNDFAFLNSDDPFFRVDSDLKCLDPPISFITSSKIQKPSKNFVLKENSLKTNESNESTAAPSSRLPSNRPSPSSFKLKNQNASPKTQPNKTQNLKKFKQQQRKPKQARNEHDSSVFVIEEISNAQDKRRFKPFNNLSSSPHPPSTFRYANVNEAKNMCMNLRKKYPNAELIPLATLLTPLDSDPNEDACLHQYDVKTMYEDLLGQMVPTLHSDLPSLIVPSHPSRRLSTVDITAQGTNSEDEQITPSFSAAQSAYWRNQLASCVKEKRPFEDENRCDFSSSPSSSSSSSSIFASPPQQREQHERAIREFVNPLLSIFASREVLPQRQNEGLPVFDLRRSERAEEEEMISPRDILRQVQKLRRSGCNFDSFPLSSSSAAAMSHLVKQKSSSGRMEERMGDGRFEPSVAQRGVKRRESGGVADTVRTDRKKEEGKRAVASLRRIQPKKVTPRFNKLNLKKDSSSSKPSLVVPHPSSEQPTRDSLQSSFSAPMRLLLGSRAASDSLVLGDLKKKMDISPLVSKLIAAPCLSQKHMKNSPLQMKNVSQKKGLIEEEEEEGRTKQGLDVPLRSSLNLSRPSYVFGQRYSDEMKRAAANRRINVHEMNEKYLDSLRIQEEEEERRKTASTREHHLDKLNPLHSSISPHSRLQPQKKKKESRSPLLSGINPFDFPPVYCPLIITSSDYGASSSVEELSAALKDMEARGADEFLDWVENQKMKL